MDILRIALFLFVAPILVSALILAVLAFGSWLISRIPWGEEDENGYRDIEVK